MNIPETPPPLPPRRILNGRVRLPPIQTRKQVNIHFNSANQKTLRRIRSLKNRAQQYRLQITPKIGKNGLHHIVLSGEPATLRTVLGTNNLVTNTPNETIMRRSRSSAILPNTIETRTPTKKPTSKSSLLRNVLEKRFINAQSKTKRTRNF